MQGSHTENNRDESTSLPSAATEAHSKVQLVGHPNDSMRAYSNNSPPVQKSQRKFQGKVEDWIVQVAC